MVTITLIPGMLMPLLTIIFGLIMIFFPRLVAFIIGVYLVLVGLIGILGAI